MKRRGATKVLSFAVTSALLGGAGVGCSRSGPTVNPGPEPVAEPDGGGGEEAEHVNEGPVDDVGTETVNEAPVDEPQPEGPIVNTQPTK